MMRTLILALAMSAMGFAVHAADSGGRTYANPACSDREANPENCVILDGSPRKPPIPGAKGGAQQGGGASTPTTPVPSGSSLTSGTGGGTSGGLRGK